MTRLADAPLDPRAPRLDETEAEALRGEVPDWGIEGDRLVRTWRFADFARGLDFVNRVGTLAEQANHHPDVHLAWGRVRVEIWTHAAGGLTRNDFVLAARIDRLTT